jgi:hypothetical protein
MGTHAIYGFVLNGKKYYLFQQYDGDFNNFGKEFITWLRHLFTSENQTILLKERLSCMKFIPLTMNEKEWCRMGDEYTEYSELFATQEEVEQKNEPDYIYYKSVNECVERYLEYGMADYYSTFNDYSYAYLYNFDNEEITINGEFGETNMTMVATQTTLMNQDDNDVFFHGDCIVEFV